MKKTPFPVLVLLAIAGTAYTFLYLLPQTHVRHVESKYFAAIKHLNESPHGIQRAEEFLREIRSINLEHVPLQIQQDMRDYADALDQALQTLKEGGDGSVYDRKIAEARDKLAADLTKYN